MLNYRRKLTREQVVRLVTQWLADPATKMDYYAEVQVNIDRRTADVIEGTREAVFTLWLKRPLAAIQEGEVIKPADFTVAGEHELPAPPKQIGTDEAKRARPPLAWTREKPTVPGLYGLVDRDGRKRALEILATPLGLIVDHHNDQSLDDWEWFYGPLPFEIPEPPKDGA